MRYDEAIENAGGYERMHPFLQKVPIPTAGLMLGALSLSKLYASLEWFIASNLLFICGLLLCILLIAKIIFAFSSVLQDLRNPVLASVAPTFTMGIMVMASMLATHQKLVTFATSLWFFAIALQFVLIGYFTYRFVIKQAVSLQEVYPSWFILYVGLGIVPVTAGTFFPAFTQTLFWVVFACYLILLPILLLRLYAHPIVEGAKPLITILAAPGSLCLTGYLQAFEQPNMLFVAALLIVSQLLYVVVLLQLPKLLRIPFYPSYAAFTFPLVICATALFTTVNVLHFPFLQWLASIELIIASGIVIYVLIRYTVYFHAMRKRKYVNTYSLR